MSDITLTATDRDVTGRAVRVQAGTKIPAVLYGHGVENVNLWIERKEFVRAFEAAGESTVVELQIGKDKANILIHDLQFDSLSNEVTHVDLFQVRMDEIVETQVPIVVVGESAAVKTLGGILTTTDSIAVRALPGDLPHDIEIDIAAIKTFDDVISTEDINLGDKVEIVSAEKLILASVVAPRTQEEVDAADEEINADISSVETVGEKKDEDGEEGETETPKED